MKITLENKGIGRNERMEARKKISEFVLDNWETLRVGADKLNELIPEDYYAPERIQHHNTRLHQRAGLKYADGVKYDELDISEQELKKSIEDIQEILDKAAEEEKFDFKIIIKKK